MDANLIRIVGEDLDFLFNEWNQDIDDASLRRSSPILRSLLVEGLLGKVAHQVGRDIRIMAPAICGLMTNLELKEMKYYQAGGAKYRGMVVQATSMIERALSAAEIKANYQRTKTVMGRSYPVKLGSFLKQTSIVVNGIFINREEVIKYVVNKLGGAHYDTSRIQSLAGNDVSLDDKYVLLDNVQKEMIVADKNAVYYELLSIGQRVVNSRDVRHLRKQLKHIEQTPPVIHVRAIP